MNSLEHTTNHNNISVREAIKLPKMPVLELKAGKKGLDRMIDNVSVYEVEDAYKWLKPNQFILSTLLAVPPSKYDEVFKELFRGEVSAIVLCYTEIYYGDFPQKLVELADTYNIPLFSAGKDIAYVDIMLPIMQAIIDKESQQLHLRIEVMNEINKLLIHGTTFTSFLSLIHKFISKPILLLDNDFEILALNATRDESKDEIMDFIKGSLEDFVQKMCEYRIPQKYIQYDYKNNSLDVFSIISNTKLNGYLIVFDNSKNNSVELKTIIEQCSEGLSILFVEYYSEMLHQQSTKMELLSIIEKKQLTLDDHKKLENGLTTLGLNISHELRFVFLTFNYKEINRNDSFYQKRKYSKIVELMNVYFNYGVCFEKENIFMMLLPYVREISFRRNLTNFLDDLSYSYEDFKCAMSSPIKENSDFNYSYNLTIQMLKLNSEIFSLDKKIIVAEEHEVFIYLHRLINDNVDDKFLVNWASKLLEPITSLKKEKDKDLLCNLITLLFNDVDVREVANKLHIHKNTLQYRMNKIKELLGVDPFHEKRFEFTLAIYVHVLNEDNEKI